jgi:phenylpyruvate tautomerase PptA (4-oxalocrotonate tautomerase family)
MPAITIQSLELTEKQKQIIADKYITIFSELTNVPKDRIYLFFDGYTLDNTATGGTLFTQQSVSKIRGKFNQDEWETGD